MVNKLSLSAKFSITFLCLSLTLSAQAFDVGSAVQQNVSQSINQQMTQQAAAMAQQQAQQQQQQTTTQTSPTVSKQQQISNQVNSMSQQQMQTASQTQSTGAQKSNAGYVSSEGSKIYQASGGSQGAEAALGSSLSSSENAGQASKDQGTGQAINGVMSAAMAAMGGMHISTGVGLTATAAALAADPLTASEAPPVEAQATAEYAQGAFFYYRLHWVLCKQ